jgi:hypothetical protein
MKTKTLAKSIALGLSLLVVAPGCYFPHVSLEPESELGLVVELPKDLVSEASKKDYSAVIELHYVEEPAYQAVTLHRFKLKDLDKKKGNVKLKGLPVGELTLSMSIGYKDKGSWVVEYAGTSERFTIEAKKQAQVKIRLEPVP